jgi:hypothetical protein
MATDRYVVDGDDLVWNVASVPPGRKVSFRVQCMSLNAAARACNQAIVTTAEGARDASEACLEIAAAPAGGADPEKRPAPEKGAASPSDAAARQSAARPQDVPPRQDAPSRDPPLPAGLSMKVTELGEQVAVGKDAMFDVRVTTTCRCPIGNWCSSSAYSGSHASARRHQRPSAKPRLKVKRSGWRRQRRFVLAKR